MHDGGGKIVLRRLVTVNGDRFSSSSLHYCRSVAVVAFGGLDGADLRCLRQNPRAVGSMMRVCAVEISGNSKDL